MKKIFVALAAAGALVPAAAQAQEATTARDGFRIEARATYETPTVSSVLEEDDVFKLGSAVAFGGEIGYDAAVGGALTVGPYAQYEFSNVETCEGEFCIGVDNYWEGGIAVGYAIGGTGALYGKLGYGEMTVEASDGVESASESGGGIAFALGYEIGFGNNLYGRIEGGYADVGEIDGINFQRRHFGVALGARF